MANLQIMTRCQMCNSKYKSSDAKVIDKKDGAITLYLNCKKCKTSIIMIIMANILGITSISAITDIAEDDFGSISANYIEYDDVLEVHKFLENK